MNIWQVVGYQNSGKTTLIETLIKQASANGLTVGTLKHHGHERGLTEYDTNKDTGRHRRAGAYVTGVSDGLTLQLQADTKSEWSIEHLLALYSAVSPDLLIIEGYKHARYPKIVCLRDQDDQALLNLPNVQAVVLSDHGHLKQQIDARMFLNHDLLPISEWVLSRVRRTEDEV